MKILFVDNHPEFTATVIASFLHDHDVSVVPTIAAAKQSLGSSTFDAVLVDYDLDDGKGDELVRWLRHRDPEARIVAVSARETGNAALVAVGACTVCAKASFARIAAVLQDLVGDSLHDELVAALQAPRGLVIVAGPTGHGKTTAIEQAIADPRCPPNVVFAGDLRDRDATRHALVHARSRVVVAAVRISRAAAVFGRLVDIEAAAMDVAEVVSLAFSTRLVRPANGPLLLLHERIVVTDAIRALIVAGADEHAIHQRAIAEGMRSLRRAARDRVAAGQLDEATAAAMTPED